ncbi:hypothetical protein CPJCM30710_23040 [Clostridium polyendosporum]|uniref:Uncharacterized protein n=1 Tax=Clostridium polyendosporum TaxID=69208 RepID=A0A919S1P4_9CLOT|nr:hypothetical protein [Clostridium polyendosporum]GIM29638.1 hypothetical protein CPJCM30710_23040 [Clostridium polyendosporum]
MIKNGIEIIGLSPQEEFTSISSPYSVPFSQGDYIFVSRRKHHIKELLKVSFDIVNLTYNEIVLKDKKILTFEGIKNYTLEYRDTHKKRITVTRTIPFNHFIELPPTVYDFDSFKILKMDGAFKNINGNMIYGNILLLIALISKKESLIMVSNEPKPDYDILSIDDTVNNNTYDNIDVKNLYLLKENNVDLVLDEKSDINILITENDNRLQPIENKEEDIEFIPEQPIVENNIVELDEEFM